MLLNLVKEYGDNWKEIAQHIPGRTAAQCRERYTNYIGSDLIKGSGWPAVVRRRHGTAEEDNMILQLQEQWGNKWSAIADVGEGQRCNVQILSKKAANHTTGRGKRSPVDVRNRFNTLKVRMIIEVDIVEEAEK